jgi:hypothetical protein
MDKQNEVNDSKLYFDISKQERDSAIRYLLGSIIKTRKEHNFPSNHYTFDEDVNVYLAHLLFAVSLPEYHEMAEPYLSLDTSDILRWVRATEDRTIRYFIFKVNADHILIHTAVFDDIAGKHDKKNLKRSHKHFQELAQLYYDQAAQYHQRIYRKQTGVGEVLQKMARYFESYQGLLKHVRRDYFGFMNSFRDKAFDHFMTEMTSYEKESQKRRKLDEFLDLYARWLNTRQPALEQEIYRRVAELKQIDSDFTFDLSRLQQGDNDERKCA